MYQCSRTVWLNKADCSTPEQSVQTSIEYFVLANRQVHALLCTVLHTQALCTCMGILPCRHAAFTVISQEINNANAHVLDSNMLNGSRSVFIEQ